MADERQCEREGENRSEIKRKFLNSHLRSVRAFINYWRFMVAQLTGFATYFQRERDADDGVYGKMESRRLSGENIFDGI